MATPKKPTPPSTPAVPSSTIKKLKAGLTAANPFAAPPKSQKTNRGGGFSNQAARQQTNGTNRTGVPRRTSGG